MINTAPTAGQRWMVMGMETENKGLIDVRDCPCDGCQAKPCGHPARCVKFTFWLNKTVDAVPVVRCKDCKHPKLPAVLTQKYGEPGTLTCHNWHSPCNKRNVKQDDFCSYGERKDNVR